MVASWMHDNKSTHWTKSLPMVQAAKNSRFHSGIGRSPFEAVFGKKMQTPIFIGTTLNSTSEKERTTSSSTLQSGLENVEEFGSTSTNLVQKESSSMPSASSSRSMTAQCFQYEDGIEVVEPQQMLEDNLDYEDFGEYPLVTFQNMEEARNVQREGARKRQAAQAEKMLESSKRK